MVIREEVPMAGWSLGTNKAEALHYSNQVFSEILLLTQVLRPALLFYQTDQVTIST